MTSTIFGIPSYAVDRAWYTHTDESGSLTAYVFLVDAPLTFGHSQLVVRRGEREFEEDVFERAATQVALCIRRFRERLPSVTSDFKYLAGYTDASGPYEKTLVLKASAAEAPHEHKFHLALLFRSNLDAANRLYQITHNQPGKAGGMLHWVDDRETLVDRDRSSPSQSTRLALFRLQALAVVLK